MSWLKHQRDYALDVCYPVPDLVCVHDPPVRMPLVQSALRLGGRLPYGVLLRNEFHDGVWSMRLIFSHQARGNQSWFPAPDIQLRAIALLRRGHSITRRRIQHEIYCIKLHNRLAGHVIVQ